MNKLDIASRPLAAELAARVPLRISAPGAALLEPDMTAQQYFHTLLAAGREADARKLLAHALPKRRALWWGCLCAWDGLRGKAQPQELAALECVIDFIHHPGEEHRRAAQSARRGLRPSSPAGTLAAAAFFSTGSISVPGAQTPIAPPEHLTGQLVGVAVYLAAAIREPARYKLHQRHYLALGEEIARGMHLWREAAGGECEMLLRADAAETLLLAGPHFLRHAERADLPALHSCGCGGAANGTEFASERQRARIITPGHANGARS